MQAIAMDTSTQVSTRKKHAAPLDPQVADRLLDLLSADDAFRKLFSHDPREALAQAGFVNITDMPSPADCKVWPLASTSRIAAARDEISFGGNASSRPRVDQAREGRLMRPFLLQPWPR